MKRWMVVAEPNPACQYGVEASRIASQEWNKHWLGESINRHWTKAGAVQTIARHHDAVWGDLIHFRLVRVRDWRKGWA